MVRQLRSLAVTKEMGRGEFVTRESCLLFTSRVILNLLLPFSSRPRLSLTTCAAFPLCSP